MDVSHNTPTRPADTIIITRNVQYLVIDSEVNESAESAGGGDTPSQSNTDSHYTINISTNRKVCRFKSPDLVCWSPRQCPWCTRSEEHTLNKLFMKLSSQAVRCALHAAWRPAPRRRHNSKRYFIHDPLKPSEDYRKYKNCYQKPVHRTSSAAHGIHNLYWFYYKYKVCNWDPLKKNYIANCSSCC